MHHFMVGFVRQPLAEGAVARTLADSDLASALDETEQRGGGRPDCWVEARLSGISAAAPKGAFHGD
jgi:hypothetical protein